MIDMPRPERAASLLEACTTAVIAQLIILTAVFVALPILFHAVVTASNSEREGALAYFARERSALIATALAPVLEGATPADADRLAPELERFATEGQTLKLFFRPPSSAAAVGVFFIAGAPVVASEQLKTSNESLQAEGAFERLIEACDSPSAPGTMVLGTGSAATILTRVLNPYGCWGVVSTQAMPVLEPFWTNSALRIIAVVYIGIALLVLGSTASLLYNLRRARVQLAPSWARIEPTLNIRLEAPSVLSVPEDAPPVSPLPTSPPAASEAAEPDLALTQEAAPSHAQAHPDWLASALLDGARTTIDLSEIVRTYIFAEQQRLERGQARLTADVADHVAIHGRADFVRTILDELVGSALGATGSAHVALGIQQDESRGRALLTVAYDAAVESPAEAFGRLSLIKQFVSALGGVSASENREDGGVTIRVAFPA
jgi:hypothetical protein